jgi:polyphosphate kinase 2 (PPK2 family)
VFNRSHYEDVLVVRVHELVPKSIWKKRYDQINDFERLLAQNDTIVLKFFLHISSDEQKKRLQERIEDPTKRWKFQHGDIEERRLWDVYRKAYEDALEKCSTDEAPWYVVPANKKWYRNHIVGSVIVDALDALGMSYPKIDLSKETIE